MSAGDRFALVINFTSHSNFQILNFTNPSTSHLNISLDFCYQSPEFKLMMGNQLNPPYPIRTMVETNVQDPISITCLFLFALFNWQCGVSLLNRSEEQNKKNHKSAFLLYLMDHSSSLKYETTKGFELRNAFKLFCFLFFY